MGIRLVKRPPINPSFSLREFQEKHNKILIVREIGGLGDILMHRMMFEDFKSLHPEFEINFACPASYHDAVRDHPFIDVVLDSHRTDIRDYIISYNTTTACCRYELKIAPFSGEHRSDIWASHCGVKLTRHNMHFNIPEELVGKAQQTLSTVKNGERGPSIALCPISATTGKNLNDRQMAFLASELKSRGCFVYALHTLEIPVLKRLGVPVISHVSILDWMGLIKAADYVISVDTAGFHFAGGVGKPVMGIFTYADGKVYGKYYDFILVQKHRDNGDWDCGPCYNWGNCPKANKSPRPCLTEISNEMLEEGINQMFARWPNRNAGNSIKLAWNGTT